MNVFGAIKILATGEELDFTGETLASVKERLAVLNGKYVYGVDWEFAGDLDIDECDIYVSGLPITANSCFVGEEAVAQLMAI